MKTRISSGAALVAALAVAAPAWAEDDPNAELKARTEALQAQTAMLQAQTADLEARTKALGLPSFEGKTTLGEGAGSMEAWMLSARAINQAAVMIAHRTNGPVLLLSADQTVNLGMAKSIRAEMAVLDKAAVDAIRPACPARAPQVPLTGAAAALPAIGAVISALKVDTEVRNLDVAASDRALLNAVAAQLKDKAIVPGEAISPGDLTGSDLNAPWQKLNDRRDAAFVCRGELAARKETPALKAQIARLDAVIERIDSFATRVAQGTAEAPSLLLRAAQMEAIARQNPKVLRVAVEHAGGSLLSRTNLFTVFGASGVSLTGGLVASYRIVDPTKATVVDAGLLVCGTDLTNMRAVHKQVVPFDDRGRPIRNPKVIGVGCRDAALTLTTTTAPTQTDR